MARSDRLEPHPVSGEVELDLDYDVQVQYRRLDEETLQALVVLDEFELFFRLVYCVNDEAGGGDGWRVGEVSVPDKDTTLVSFMGYPNVAEAEKVFGEKKSNTVSAPRETISFSQQVATQPEEEGDDDDDDYWARYDATPARTPQIKHSPAPGTSQQNHNVQSDTTDADEAYYAQYDSVQPAMDNHDPDEAEVADQLSHVQPPPPLGLQYSPDTMNVQGDETDDMNETNGSWTLAPSPSARSRDEEERTSALAHPRPESSASSNGSNTVLKLEEQAGRQEQSEFGVKQHVSRSIRSLFLLSRTAGIDRDEFERMVKNELDVLGMVENDI